MRRRGRCSCLDPPASTRHKTKLPDALAALRARAPEVTVSLTEAEPPAALTTLRAGESDLAIVFSYSDAPPDGDTRFRRIPLLLVARGLAVTALPALAFTLHHEPGVLPLPAPALGRRHITALVPAGPRPPAVAALLDELVIAARAAC